MSCPAELTTTDVFVNRLQAELESERLIRDPMHPLALVLARHAVHPAHALVVEVPQPVEDWLGEAPSLAAIEQNCQDEAGIRLHSPLCRLLHS